jgi:hypothetical protein
VTDEAEQLDRRGQLVNSGTQDSGLRTQDSGVFITVSDSPKELHLDHVLVVPVVLAVPSF